MSIQTLTEKEQCWQEMAKHCSHITDRLGQSIDRGILETVIALNVLGIPTVQSCEGHIDHGVCAPWVFFTSTSLDDFHEYEQITKRHREDQERILFLLEEFYADRCVPHNRMLIVYRHKPGVSILESQGARHRRLEIPEKRAQFLNACQDEMNHFTTFLKKRFFEGEHP